ncbi:MAG TPA: response regulator [Terriglobales bacterium]|jgi:signal transduction histidine kinase|nr:response regulator [Terriglobales bacterium]
MTTATPKTLLSPGIFEILFFEDSPADSMLVQSYMESATLPARFTVVERLSEGLNLLASRHFDVALLDLNLPDSQGAESLDRLHTAAPQLPVVAVTSILTPDLAVELLRKGAQDCLLKSPALAVMLANAIRYAIERQHTAAELDERNRRIQASEARIRAIIDASMDAILVVDRAGNVRFVNRAVENMFGRSASEIVDQPFSFPLDDGQASEVGITRQDGSTTLAEMRVVPTDWDGEKIHLAFLRDITERKQMEQALARADKMQALGTLAGGIAHDFNNILLTVSGNAKLALEELSEDHPARLSVLEIAKAGSRAVALTRKILSFSRQEESKRQLMEVEPVLEGAISWLRSTLPSGIEIRENFMPGLPQISADPLQVHQVIVNLAMNAVDALGGKPGVLELTASPIKLNGNGSSLSSKLLPGRYVKLSIKDTGPGMDKPTLGRVFEPFFTTKAQGRGTGMGLAVVHGIVKNHLGEVTAYSEVGKGTVFNLYFPAEETAEAAHAEHTKARGSGQRILYVDDEEPLVLLITRTLTRLGYQVVGFSNPAEALHSFAQHPQDFDAMVTDLSMPSMSGTDLAQAVLQIRPELPVVLTSGYIRAQDQEIARRVGVRELILKPDTVEDLGDTLHRLLGTTAKKSKASAGQRQ